jgi:hypothetical protein
MLFAPSTQEPWRKLVSRFEMAFRSESLWDKFEVLDSMREDKTRFLRAAAQEIGIPYQELAPEDPEARELRRAKTLEMLQAIEPRVASRPPDPTEADESNSEGKR